ncbi:MAG TPA: NADH-quinone oxidoreductase subunit L [Pseudomonadota bacterium]|nr:NADH-quinone oxidoreductase subunit L [Pseudomonadota bacterium]
MTQNYPLYLIALLPLLGAALNLLFGRRWGNSVVSLVACGSVAGAALVATKGVLLLAHDLPTKGMLVDQFFAGDWITAGDLHLAAGLMLDRLSSIMVLIVTWIALLIHIYATGYMEHEPDYARFFGYLNLFTGSMLILVLGDSLPVTFVGWEGVGLCSYLLIGFWYQEDKNATAGRKAFIVNRIGDFGFLLGICLLYTLLGTVKYAEFGSLLNELRKPFWMGWPAGYWVAVFLFIGCMGKSAQIPLYVWLPDAMAGPTPVSALIHAATMVTAGVYVVARTHGIFDITPSAAQMLVSGVGAITALMAATIGIVQRDFKKVLAYSTVSQLGFMFVGVGSGAYVAGVMHLMTHAFFKAGLFLGAGSVMHAMGGEGDITKMGGLGKHMPITRWTFFVYCLAIAGIFPFAGFFSKDAILAGAFASKFVMADTANPTQQMLINFYPKFLWATLTLAAFCTAFYMWRLYFVVFTGEFRGTKDQEHHLHESPPEMTLPLVVLAAGAVLSGLIGIPAVMTHGLPESVEHITSLFEHWLVPAMLPASPEPASHGLEWGLMAGATTISVLGIALAARLYRGGISETANSIKSSLQPVYTLLWNKYFVDEIYDLIFVRPTKMLARVLWRVADAVIVDGGLTKLGPAIVGWIGARTRRLQNGDVQRYLIMVVLGAGSILFLSTFWLPYRGVQGEITKQGRKVTLVLGEGKVPNNRLVYRIDWDGDGKFEDENVRQAEKGFFHDYPSAGTYRIVVEAHDPIWHVGKSSADWFLGAKTPLTVTVE